MGWQHSRVPSIWQLRAQTPTSLTLLDQTLTKQPVLPKAQTSSSPAPAEPQASPYPNPATSQVPDLGSVLRTKGWLLVQLPVDPRASSWKTGNVC